MSNDGLLIENRCFSHLVPPLYLSQANSMSVNGGTLFGNNSVFRLLVPSLYLGQSNCLRINSG